MLFGNLFAGLLQRTPKKSRRRAAHPSVETLEVRRAMAGLGSPTAEVNYYAAESAPLATATSANIIVNGRGVEVKNGGLLQLNAGDKLQVGGIHLAAGPALAQTGGVIAVEGYLQKISPETPGGELDYDDGRFGSGVTCADAAKASSHPGLTGSWKMQAGWDELRLMVMHYEGDGVAIVSQFSVRLQVGQPEFEARLSDWKLGSTKIVPFGEEIHFKGMWSNAGQGTYFNYAEVDVFRVSDMTKPVWVGTLAGLAEAGKSVEGEFLNDPNDAFTSAFKPEQPGEYIVRVTADPENAWSEVNEGNVVEYRLMVQQFKRTKDVPTPFYTSSAGLKDNKREETHEAGLRQTARTVDAVIAGWVAAADKARDKKCDKRD